MFVGFVVGTTVLVRAPDTYVRAALGIFVYLQRTEPAWYARLWYPLNYASIVRGHSAHYDLDPALLAAVIETESKFNTNARSSAGQPWWKRS